MIEESYTVNVLENASVGLNILTIKVHDADTNEKHTFSIISSPSPSSLDLFSIDSWSGVLRVKQALDYEKAQQHVLIVEVADSLFTKMNARTTGVSSTSPSMLPSSSSSLEADENRPARDEPSSTSSHRAFTRIIINVLDVNDHSVSCLFPSFPLHSLSILSLSLSSFFPPIFSSFSLLL